ncbi:MAG: hypothetical protein WCZ48_07330 [Bacillota bacterium]|jgi:hypothetical protein
MVLTSTMGKQPGCERLAQGICLRSEVPVAGRSGLTYSHDDHYRARQNPAGESAGHRWASLKLGSPHVDFTAMSFTAEQNRCDQGVRGRSVPLLLNVSLSCNLLHSGGAGRQGGMTHWRASFGGK